MISIGVSIVVTVVVLIVVLSAVGSQVGPAQPGDDMSGLWIVVVGGLILITVGPLSWAIAFAIAGHRLQVPSRGRWAVVVGVVLLIVAAVAAAVLRSFLSDRGVGELSWLVGVALAGMAVAGARIVTRYSPGRRELIVVAAGVAVVVVAAGVAWLNADRHDRAVSYGLIDQRDVTLALPGEGATWTVVDMSSPTGYTARELSLTATLSDNAGRSTEFDPAPDRHEPCHDGCVTVATLADGRLVRTKRTAYASWYVVDAGVGYWAIRSGDHIAPADAAALFEQLREVTIDEWLDADRSLDRASS